MIEILSRIKLIQLRELGQNRKISKYYKMKKAELIDAIVTWNEQKFHWKDKIASSFLQQRQKYGYLFLAGDVMKNYN